MGPSEGLMRDLYFDYRAGWDRTCKKDIDHDAYEEEFAGWLIDMKSNENNKENS